MLTKSLDCKVREKLFTLQCFFSILNDNAGHPSRSNVFPVHQNSPECSGDHSYLTRPENSYRLFVAITGPSFMTFLVTMEILNLKNKTEKYFINSRDVD